MLLPLLNSPFDIGFLSVLDDRSRSASDRSLTTKPKTVLSAENISSLIILGSVIAPANNTPTRVVDVKHSSEGSRIAV